MVCNKCYYDNESNARFCVKCGEKLQPEIISQNSSNVKNTNNVNYKNQNNVEIKYSPANAIVVLILSICCCSSIPGIIFAILSLVEGGKINPNLCSGNIEAARISYEQSKKWTKYAWISMAIWAAVIILLYVLYFVFIIGLVTLSNY